MKKMTGGQLTRGGVYISLRSGEFITVPQEGGELPGAASITYVRTPAAIAAILGPIVGLAYVIFLPLVGLVTLAWLAGREVKRGVRAMQAKTAELTGAEWQPGTSHFARRQKGRGQAKGKKELEQLEKEIEQREKGRQ